MFMVRCSFWAVWIPVALASAQIPAGVVASRDASTLASVKRICVENLVGDQALVAPAKEIAIAALFASKRYTVTEKCDKADAVLKGAVLERGENRVRADLGDHLKPGQS